jgi:hypothetical protein
MDDQFNSILIINKKDYINIEKELTDSIINVLQLDDKFLVQIEKSNLQKLNTLLDNASETHNINIAIASAITAGARIYMSQFKNNQDYNLYYTDTDSIYIDKELPSDLVSDKVLGKLKLEHIAKKAIFLAPKLYSLLTENNNVIYKCKGLNHDVKLSLNDFESLLSKNYSLIKSQDKWFKSLSNGNISILEQIYTIQVT